MPAAAESRPNRGSWWMWLLLPVFPLYLLFLVFMLCWMYAESGVSRRRRANSLKRAMRTADRVATWSDVSAHLAEQPGTLIVDTPCLGWHDTDVWWTGELVAEQLLHAGIPLPLPLESESSSNFDARMENPLFDRWCRSQFFDPKSGRGKLVQSTLSAIGKGSIQRRVAELQRAHPNLMVVHACSAFAEFADDWELRKRSAAGTSHASNLPHDP